jgi:hypothetical protein
MQLYQMLDMTAIFYSDIKNSKVVFLVLIVSKHTESYYKIPKERREFYYSCFIPCPFLLNRFWSLKAAACKYSTSLGFNRV